MSENSKKSSDPQIVLMAEQAQKTQSKQGKYKRKIFIIVVVLLVLVGCLVLWRLFSTDSNKTAVFTIEDKAYSSEEVDSLIAYPVSNGSNKDGAARQVYYYLKRQAAAKKANFEPSAD
jgi:flagellar basal body-associated protein FliL